MLLALLPLSQPPDACVAISFSLDGRHFSSPVNLRGSDLGWRTSEASGLGELECHLLALGMEQRSLPPEVRVLWLQGNSINAAGLFHRHTAAIFHKVYQRPAAPLERSHRRWSVGTWRARGRRP